MSGEATTSPTPDSGPTDYASRLRAVDKYIHKSLFAQVSRHVRPYTDQQKTDIRYRIDEDSEAYDEADERQRESSDRYVRLRIYTAIILILFFAASIILTWLLFPLTITLLKSIVYPSEAASIVAVPTLLLTILIFGAFAIYIRLHVRKHVLSDIDDDVRNLAFYVAGRFNSIKKETTDACIQIDTRASNGADSWAQRARGWSRIALWNIIRGDQLDRYATNVLWKMEVEDTRVEAISRFLKGWILLLSLFSLFYLTGNVEQRSSSVSPLLTLYFLFVALIFWPAASYFLFFKWGNRIGGRHWIVPVATMLGLYLPVATIWFLKGSMQAVDFATPLVGLLFLVAFWLGWIVLGEKDDSLCTHHFKETLRMDKHSVPNTSFYFDILSDRIQNLVEQITDKDRSGGTRGAPAPSTRRDRE